MTNVKVTNVKNTAGKSANENSDNNDNGHISDNFYFLFFVCFEGSPE